MHVSMFQFRCISCHSVARNDHVVACSGLSENSGRSMRLIYETFHESKRWFLTCFNTDTSRTLQTVISVQHPERQSMTDDLHAHEDG